LYEAWSTFLPPFIRDNVLDQLILPKVHQAVNDWNPRKDTVSLQALVFPWLPHLGLRLEDLLGDARRKVKSLVRGWSAEDEMPKDLAVWKDVSAPAIYTEMIAHYLLFTGFQWR
jgi:tuftelin-interacting protein 11